MVSQIQTQPKYLPEDYLALEIVSETRNEYIDGEIIPMAGGMPNHNQIALNIAGNLNFVLKRQPYRVFLTDQRLWIPQYRVYTYPDVMLVSGDLMFQEGRKDTIINPTLIIEVLSKSTGSFDRDKKFDFYRSLPSFQEYLLVDQYRYSVQRYVKISTKKWEFEEYDSLEEEIKFSTVPATIALTEIYDKVELEQSEYGTR
jgi:Uma2 family endonuclease